MKCVVCNAPTDIEDTRVTKLNEVIRKRKCFNGHKFKTKEQYDNSGRKKTYGESGGTGLRGLPQDGV